MVTPSLTELPTAEPAVPTDAPVVPSIPASPPAATPRPKRDPFKRPTRIWPEGRLSASRFFGALAMVGLAVWITREAWVEITNLAWIDTEYSHILLVPLVAMFLVYVRRLRLRHFRVASTWVGPILVALGMALYTIGLERNKQGFFHLGAVATALGALVSVFGKNALFKFMPAVVVLAFLIPVPYNLRLGIAKQLQEWTVHVDWVLLQILNVETTFRGNTFYINGNPVMVAEACNGMRLVFPLFLIAYAFSFGLPLRNGVRVLLLVSSPIVALVANVVRTLPLIWIYGFNTPLGNTLHDISGWLMLPLSFLVLMGLIRLMRWAMLPVQRYSFSSQ